MATIEVSFSALPAHVRTARLVATAVARRSGVADGLLDEIRLAVGEACSRAVGLHRRSAPQAPVRMTLEDEQDRFTVTIADAAPPDAPPTMLDALDPAALAAPQDSAGPDDLPDPLPPGIGLAVVAGLVRDLDVRSGADGTRVSMSWSAQDAMAPAETPQPSEAGPHGQDGHDIR
jgi:anti-sigma regulatory factor (Ser/Thr protein kinase)